MGLIVFLIMLFVIYYLFWRRTEGFNETVGRFCSTCRGKTYNQCTNCFNCGFCVDKYGNMKCVAGDHKGQYNYEDCAVWYSGDRYSDMMKMNGNYKCSYGPHQMNRIY